MTFAEQISVVIPVFNAERFVAEAIESALTQSYSPLEIIVIDDGSTDDTESVVKNMDGNIRYEYQENQGPSRARNKGIELAEGNFLAFLDADDVWLPWHLSNHLELFNEFKNLDISVGLTCELEFDKASDVDLKKAEKNSILHLSLCTSLIKKAVFEEVGFFDEDLMMGEDTDWFLKAREKQKTIAISRELHSLYRRHENNSTNNMKMKNFYFFRVFKKAKDRRANSDISLNTIMKKPENVDDLIEIWHTAESRE